MITKCSKLFDLFNLNSDHQQFKIGKFQLGDVYRWSFVIFLTGFLSVETRFKIDVMTHAYIF
jgi:hypothetical protein